MSFKEKVLEVIDESIRPALQADGGNIELIDAKEGTVIVHLTGACATCSMAQLTLRQGVESILKESLPEVERVEAV